MKIKVKKMLKNEDGVCIEPGSSLAIKLGFDEKLFKGYLWKKGNEIWISFIYSLFPGRGNVSVFIRSLLDKGYDVCIPTPLGVMKEFVKKYNFAHEIHYHQDLGEVNVWRISPPILLKVNSEIGAK